MNEIRANTGQMVVLGRQGENLARCVIFDVIEWQRMYGEGTVQLIHKRHQDKYAYPCSVEVAKGVARWEIQRADVATPGEGKAELQYYVNDALVKSAPYRTLTMPSLGDATPEPPEPEQSWVDAVLKAASEVEEAAKDAVIESLTIGKNGNWFINGKDTGVPATGPHGEPGLPRVVTVPGTDAHAGTLLNNTEYRCTDPVTTLTVTGFDADPDGRCEVWGIHFVAGETITVTLPDSVVWNYNAAPVFTPGSEYWLLFTPMLNGKVLGVWNEVET